MSEALPPKTWPFEAWAAFAMIDIHCHLLPGIDDGPPTVEAALGLANALVADGVTKVVCTPHVFPGRFENRKANIAADCKSFVALLEAASISLEVLWAGEVRLTPEVLDLFARAELPFLGLVSGFKTMLLEMPDGQVPLGADRFVRHFVDAGVRPVVVHPERNRAVMDRVDRLQMFIDAGCYVQLTAGSLVGQFGSKAQVASRELIERGWVHAVASDAHNLVGRRPRMRDAAAWLTKNFGAKLAHQLTVLGPAGLCGQNGLANHQPL